mmetsp:Transcript_10349/g.26776  ORF Transcript_10349/g.26776 Transcript_10349/m.26776 type:complete len:356 (-) Transcript_10349:181-1248(-)|eukprot:CAMPEP_0195097878 /NCGR_PEP_ID=MMETSP0448-20130528/55069_1 /TAXON_ID=66468 /ORGANISM="Heterocapsa triquestra, Strain CCMP 448" /LENGTH=355 /DNA_ID=CAMNT_0040132483 /DNA_START=79 /DNA_END=1146 /DNA_ORIENTATION=+
MPAKTFRMACAKTKPCKFFLRGRCAQGPTCNFAHSIRELRRTPDSTPPCPNIISDGQCLDDACPLSHGRSSEDAGSLPTLLGSVLNLQVEELQWDQTQEGPGDMGSTPMGVAPSMNTNDSCQSGEAAGSREIVGTAMARRKFHKSKLCAFFPQGRCRKKDECQFAHSLDEVHPLLRRTKLCPMLLVHGECNNADCQFAHSMSELREKERRTPAQTCEDTASPQLSQDSQESDTLEEPASLLSAEDILATDDVDRVGHRVSNGSVSTTASLSAVEAERASRVRPILNAGAQMARCMPGSSAAQREPATRGECPTPPCFRVKNTFVHVDDGDEEDEMVAGWLLCRRARSCPPTLKEV